MDASTPPQPCAGRGLITKITYVSPTSGIFRSFAYDQYGNKVDEWNELGEGTHYTYDNYNRLKSVAKGGETTTYSYNPTNGGASPYLHTTNNPARSHPRRAFSHAMFTILISARPRPALPGELLGSNTTLSGTKRA